MLPAFSVRPSAHAHRKCARFGNARAIVRRGKPVQLQWWAGILPEIAPKNPFSGRAMGDLQMARWCNSAPDLPDVSKGFSGCSRHSCQRHHATLHGVVFDILVWACGAASLGPVGTVAGVAETR